MKWACEMNKKSKVVNWHISQISFNFKFESVVYKPILINWVLQNFNTKIYIQLIVNGKYYWYPVV